MQGIMRPHVIDHTVQMFQARPGGIGIDGTSLQAGVWKP